MNHILLYDVRSATKSKFLPDQSCPDELYDLFAITIKRSINTNSTKHKHRGHASDVSNVIYYRATFEDAVSTFTNTDGTKLYQFEVVVIYENGSFVTAFGYGDGYPGKRIQPGDIGVPYPYAIPISPARQPRSSGSSTGTKRCSSDSGGGPAPKRKSNTNSYSKCTTFIPSGNFLPSGIVQL